MPVLARALLRTNGENTSGKANNVQWIENCFYDAKTKNAAGNPAAFLTAKACRY
ncbi:hypothetical protein ACFOEE_05235 [Pseudoalteromonas fenneropenaei]|uniref:Uncharacterized protein n=1 Tax=Pseudoalteromonas fenneropenaei TaxID=1737459 RepID=A0ABV7CH30_9GAMM